MPWKERYTISDERTLPDSEVRWPDRKRCCFRIVVDLAPELHTDTNNKAAAAAATPAPAVRINSKL